MFWTKFKSVGHSLKNLISSQKTLRPHWRPKLVMGLHPTTCYENKNIELWSFIVSNSLFALVFLDPLIMLVYLWNSHVRKGLWCGICDPYINVYFLKAVQNPQSEISSPALLVQAINLFFKLVALDRKFKQEVDLNMLANLSHILCLWVCYWIVSCWCVMTRATKSQNFSVFLKVCETSTNQLSCWCHESLQSYYVKKIQNYR